jgi:hypothetical protein
VKRALPLPEIESRLPRIIMKLPIKRTKNGNFRRSKMHEGCPVITSEGVTLDMTVVSRLLYEHLMRKKTKLHLEASALEASNKGRELHEAC